MKLGGLPHRFVALVIRWLQKTRLELERVLTQELETPKSDDEDDD